MNHHLLFKTWLTATILLVSHNVKAHQYLDLLQKIATPAALKENFVPKQDWIKYPSYTNRNGWNTLTGSLKNEIILKGELYLSYEWRIIKATDYLEFEKSGSRLAMENPFGANNTALSNLLLAELAEGKGRFIPQLINGVWQACEMSSWALSAHLPAQKTKRSLPDYSEEIIDLTSGDLGSFLSWTYYFLKEEFDKANPIIAKKLRLCLQQRILDPYMNRSDYWWQAFNAQPATMVNNWNPWCNFNVLTCFLLLEENPDKLAEAVYRTMISVDKFINYNHTDGACEEGPSYWGHAAGKLYDYLQLIHNVTNGKVSIFGEPIIKNMGEYIARSYVGNGWVVNFADASAKGGGNAGLIYRYGKAVNSTDMQQFAAYLHQHKLGNNDINAGRDLFRTLENLSSYNALANTTATLTTHRFSWYQETQFCYMQNNKGLFFAAKGGHNNESHNHNDVGSFTLYYHTEPMLIDVGVGTYTRQTFSSERYTIWNMQSNYHNLPMINGKPQNPGNEYRAKNVQFNASQNSFALDIAGAYGKEAGVLQWQRNYVLSTAGGLTITEQFTIKQPSTPNQLHYMSWAEPVLTKQGEITLSKNGKTVLLQYDKNTFDAAIEQIALTDQRLVSVWGNVLFRIILTAKKIQTSGIYKVQIQPA
ncbi:heparinase II/III domain-containing protein [Phnomibacter sp. MR]|uniref:heparinase II/III domain-containing protein n=1 Tax=Phnomibacter sp. MR TaxID=3042318 RepID=UPI003A806A5D